MPSARPIRTQPRLTSPALRLRPRVKNAIQPMNIAHTGSSSATALKVAADEATTDSPATIRRCWPQEWLVDMRCLWMDARGQQVAQLDAMQELGTDTVGDRGDHFAAVAGRVDVHAERPVAE